MEEIIWTKEKLDELSEYVENLHFRYGLEEETMKEIRENINIKRNEL